MKTRDEYILDLAEAEQALRQYAFLNVATTLEAQIEQIAFREAAETKRDIARVGLAKLRSAAVAAAFVEPVPPAE